MIPSYTPIAHVVICDGVGSAVTLPFTDIQVFMMLLHALIAILPAAETVVVAEAPSPVVTVL